MLLLSVVFYLCYSVYFYEGRWMTSAYNPRIKAQKEKVIMGTVTDREGVVLAYTDEETNERKYNSNEAVRRAVSQTLGDNESKVSTGADTFYAQYLLGFKAGLVQKLTDALSGEKQRGDDVQLTISSRLCRYISEQFPGDKRGAVTVINYRTGEVLAMVSFPQFDPMNLSEALEDEEAGALMNRATQGLYPPGSTFKIVTLASAIENLPDLPDFVFDCTGYYPVGTYSVTENTAHGMQTLSDAFANSCNTAFAAISQQLGYQMLGNTAEKLLFNTNFIFNDIVLYNSSYPIDNLSDEDLAWSAIGQGRVLTTPMHMALIACTLANHGIFREPRLLARIVTPMGNERLLPSAAGDRRVLKEGVAEQIEKVMVKTVREGTGTRAALGNGYVVAGKTGTAEISDENGVSSHAWFVGYLTNENAPYAISIIVEKGGGGGRVAAPLARKVLQKAIDLGL